ncbi:hypothetical protein [Corynebacterium sp. NML130628]|nr:hypothetical protein [Corynebacterium sp. NML130628]
MGCWRRPKDRRQATSPSATHYRDTVFLTIFLALPARLLIAEVF